jgi:hypothetical protein
MEGGVNSPPRSRGEGLGVGRFGLHETLAHDLLSQASVRVGQPAFFSA